MFFQLCFFFKLKIFHTFARREGGGQTKIGDRSENGGFVEAIQRPFAKEKDSFLLANQKHMV